MSQNFCFAPKSNYSVAFRKIIRIQTNILFLDNSSFHATGDIIWLNYDTNHSAFVVLCRQRKLRRTEEEMKSEK